MKMRFISLFTPSKEQSSTAPDTGAYNIAVAGVDKIADAERGKAQNVTFDRGIAAASGKAQNVTIDTGTIAAANGALCKAQNRTLSTARRLSSITAWETAVFPMLGAIMFCSKIIMEFLPNIHLLGMLIMTYTIVFRKKALIPIYIYVFLDGLYGGFGTWWLPYLYIWTILWAVTMLLPRNMPKKVAATVYPVVCCLHGLAFGTLYAPAYALIMRMSFQATVAWIVAGFPWDAMHGAGNFVAGLLILPMSALLQKLADNRYNKRRPGSRIL